MSNDKAKYRVEIQQMMFVSGETGEPSAETTMLLEEIVRSQVIEMVPLPPFFLQNTTPLSLYV